MVGAGNVIPNCSWQPAGRFPGTVAKVLKTLYAWQFVARPITASGTIAPALSPCPARQPTPPTRGAGEAEPAGSVLPCVLTRKNNAPEQDKKAKPSPDRR